MTLGLEVGGTVYVHAQKHVGHQRRVAGHEEQAHVGRRDKRPLPRPIGPRTVKRLGEQP